MFNKKKVKKLSIFFVVLFLGLFVVKTTSHALGVGDYIDIAFGTLINGLAWLLYQLCRPIMYFFASAIKMTGGFVAGNVVNLVWQVMRDIVNMTFIIAMLVTAVYKMVGAEGKLPQKSFDKQILYILIGAFLINFSRVICGAFVDLTNLISMMFVNSYGDAIGNIFRSIFKIDTTMGIQSRFAPAVMNLIFVLALFAYAVTILAYAIIRMLILALTTALSPLMVFIFFFPKKIKQLEELKIRDQFFQFAVGGITVSFYLWIALMFLTAGGKGNVGLEEAMFAGNDDSRTAAMGSVTLKEVTTSTTGASYANEIPDAGTIVMKFMGILLLLTFQKSAMAMAKSVGFKMGDFVGKAMDGVNKVGMAPMNFAKNQLKSTAKMAKEIGLTTKDAAVGGAKKWINTSDNILARSTNKVFGVAENLRKSNEDRDKRLSNRSAKYKAANTAEGRKDLIEFQGNKATEVRKIGRDTKMHVVDTYARKFKTDQDDFITNEILNDKSNPMAVNLANRIKQEILTNGYEAGKTMATAEYNSNNVLKATIDTKYKEAHNKKTNTGRIAILTAKKADRERRMKLGEKFDKKDLDVIDKEIEIEKAKIEKERTHKEFKAEENELNTKIDDIKTGDGRDRVETLTFKKKEYDNEDKNLKQLKKNLDIQLNSIGFDSMDDLEEEYENLNNRIASGAGTIEDNEKLNEIMPLMPILRRDNDAFVIKETEVNNLKLTPEEEKFLDYTNSSVGDKKEAYTDSISAINKAHDDFINEREKARGVAVKKENEEWKKFKDAQGKVRDKHKDKNGEFKHELIDLSSYFDKESFSKEGDDQYKLTSSIEDFSAAVGLKIKESEGNLSPLENEILNSQFVRTKIKDYINTKDNGFKKEWNGLFKDKKVEKYGEMLKVVTVDEKAKKPEDIVKSQTEIMRVQAEYSKIREAISLNISKRKQNTKDADNLKKKYEGKLSAIGLKNIQEVESEIGNNPAPAPDRLKKLNEIVDLDKQQKAIKRNSKRDLYIDLFSKYYASLTDKHRETIDAAALKRLADNGKPATPENLKLYKGYEMEQKLKPKKTDASFDDFIT